MNTSKGGEMIKPKILKPEIIGDNLDLEVEAEYPCSDGSSTMTISVDKLLETQNDYCYKIMLGQIIDFVMDFPTKDDTELQFKYLIAEALQALEEGGYH